jgi:hypothetical protein
LFLYLSSSISSGRREISFEMRRASSLDSSVAVEELVSGQPPCLGVGEGYCPIRLAIDMRQDNAVGVDDPVSAGIGSTFQGLGKRREGMAEAN